MADINGMSINIGDKVVFSRSGKSNYLQKGRVKRFTSKGIIITSDTTGQENIRHSNEIVFNGWINEYEESNPERFLG
jgi:hypothetical protein